jgi:hypothetical protein
MISSTYVKFDDYICYLDNAQTIWCVKGQERSEIVQHRKRATVHNKVRSHCLLYQCTQGIALAHVGLWLVQVTNALWL